MCAALSCAVVQTRLIPVYYACVNPAIAMIRGENANQLFKSGLQEDLRAGPRPEATPNPSMIASVARALRICS